MEDDLLAIGIMSGNSLDGVDAVLTRFQRDGGLSDLCCHHLTWPAALAHSLRKVRAAVHAAHGAVEEAARDFDAREAEHPDPLAKDLAPESQHPLTLHDVESCYTASLARTVRELLSKASIDPQAVDIIGSHGQTCAHLPPSVANSRDPRRVYTVQLGDGQKLANQLGISVVCDFRSDDLMNGGEAAPLAALHHQHLAAAIRGQRPHQGRNALAFCNAGNSGNLTLISEKMTGAEPVVFAWDLGPFNHFPDLLVRTEQGKAYDVDGCLARPGRINLSLLRLLFEGAVTTAEGENFLALSPPKSSDPNWYRAPPELLGRAPVEGKTLCFSDRLRSANYFSVYLVWHGLSTLPATIRPPSHLILSGGGWRNPLCVEDLRRLAFADPDEIPMLEEHREGFLHLRSSTKSVQHSDHYGFLGSVMEARLFADAAVSRIRGEPLTTPSVTGVGHPTVAGILRFPQGNERNATPRLRSYLDKHQSRDLTRDPPGLDPRWSRATAGWYERFRSLARP